MREQFLGGLLLRTAPSPSTSSTLRTNNSLSGVTGPTARRTTPKLTLGVGATKGSDRKSLGLEGEQDSYEN